MAKKKRKPALKKKRTLFLRLQRPLTTGAIAIVLLGLTLTPHTNPVKHTGAPAKKVAVAAAPSPKQQSVIPKTTTAPAKTSSSSGSSAAAMTPKTTVATVLPQSTKPEPVVTPSPSSSVSSLAPVTQSSSPPAGDGSATTQSSPAPATTTGYTSSNWSGYMATTGNFTTISGSWIVPTITGPSGETSADSTWIGIGGVSSSDLIQVGTQDTVSANGQTSSSAFYELLPSSSTTIPSLTVAVGDHMSASLAEVSGGEWVITITDETSDETFTTDTSYTSSNSSAEWIEEDPSYAFRRQIPLDYFGSVSFTGGTTTSNGTNLSIVGSNAEPVTMLNATGTPVSTPSVLSGGSFSITRDT